MCPIIADGLHARYFNIAPNVESITVDFISGGDIGRARVIGAAGAVRPCDALFVGNLELGDVARVPGYEDETFLSADADGAFEAEIDAVAGTHILVARHPKWGTSWGTDSDEGPSSVLLRLPVEEASEGIAFSSAMRLSQYSSDAWVIRGTLATDAFMPGQRVPISGRVILQFQTDAQPPRSRLRIGAFLIGDGEGRQVGRVQDYATAFLTPTGLPIEMRFIHYDALDSLSTIEIDWKLDDGNWVADFDRDLSVPDDYPDGLYELTANLHVPIERDSIRSAFRHPANCCEASLGNVTIGDPAPMRLAATLLADVVSEGTRGGVRAREDSNLFDFSPRVMTRHDPVIPRLDSYDELWTYRLEPYVPFFGTAESGAPPVPPIALDFLDSELTVTIFRPDGQTQVLGPAPLTRYVFLRPTTPDCNGGAIASGKHPSGMPQLQGEGDTFAYQFPLDGDYVITLGGHITDQDGRMYEISGTYDVTVANVLDIETAMLPGTPFEVGDAIPPTLTVMPGVPADITYAVTHIAADGETTARVFTGRANANGWWDGDGELFTFERDGKFRIDVEGPIQGPRWRAMGGPTAVR